jgi:hypothetical protein
MKALAILLGAVALLAFSSDQPAQAQNAPWCAVISTGFDNTVWDCRYYSIEHCRPNVVAGNRGFCVPNYRAEAPPARRSRYR